MSPEVAIVLLSVLAITTLAAVVIGVVSKPQPAFATAPAKLSDAQAEIAPVVGERRRRDGDSTDRDVPESKGSQGVGGVSGEFLGPDVECQRVHETA